MKKFLYIVGAVLALGILSFAYYAISPLFRHMRVDEAIPQMQTTEAEESEQLVGVAVVGTPGHPSSGTVRILEAEGKQYIRYENFKTINGPDLYVYLAKDLNAKEFVNIGALRATEGNVNYELPSDINPSEYRYVLTWCKQFSVLFNYADLKASEDR